jgi:hypothetical protein
MSTRCADVPRAYHVATPDRLGLAILSGGVLAGAIAMMLVIAGGERSAAALGLAWAMGTVAAMCGIVALVGPVWLILHRRGLRGPSAAAAVAGSVVLVVFATAQLWGTGGGAYRWISAVATSALLALVAAAIGAVMHRIAYRRLM